MYVYTYVYICTTVSDPPSCPFKRFLSPGQVPTVKKAKVQLGASASKELSQALLTMEENGVVEGKPKAPGGHTFMHVPPC